MTVAAIIQARMNSSRLPGKVMRDLNGAPVLAWVVRACRQAAGVDLVGVATTTREDDDIVNLWCDANDVQCYRGSENDLISRYIGAADQFGAPDIILRITADCPFLDPIVVAQVVRLQKITGAAYVTNIYPRTFADGEDTECFTRSALEAADGGAVRAIDREVPTYWIMRNQSRFSSATVINPLPNQETERYVLDTEQDWKFCAAVAFQLGRFSWKARAPTQTDILEILDKNPEYRVLNCGHIMNERFFSSLANEEPPSKEYGRSRSHLIDAEKIIPLGAQTFSKSRLQFPLEAPLFVSHGQGGLVWDIQGQEYVDLVGGLMTTILGHHDPDVDYAIRDQLNRGISFSLATELEAQLAEKLVGLIPSAEMVRFGKTGTDVTTAAVRLARAYTGRKYTITLQESYHGWGGWSADQTRSVGVPTREREGTVCFSRHLVGEKIGGLTYGDVASIVIEPYEDPGFLKKMREFCDKEGIVLIFDEIQSWPRWHLRGAQYMFDVTPDLTCISKGMANGMPLSAICGRRDIMKRMEPPDNIFYSGTFFGEALSIAASIATIGKLEREDVIGHLKKEADALQVKVRGRIKAWGVEDLISVNDHPVTRVAYKNRKVQDKFIEFMCQAGVLIINANNLCFAHSRTDIQRVLKGYEIALSRLAGWERAQAA